VRWLVLWAWCRCSSERRTAARAREEAHIGFRPPVGKRLTKHSLLFSSRTHILTSNGASSHRHRVLHHERHTLALDFFPRVLFSCHVLINRTHPNWRPRRTPARKKKLDNAWAIRLSFLFPLYQHVRFLGFIFTHRRIGFFFFFYFSFRISAFLVLYEDFGRRLYIDVGQKLE
jgi:hypothetical protein